MKLFEFIKDKFFTSPDQKFIKEYNKRERFKNIISRFDSLKQFLEDRTKKDIDFITNDEELMLKAHALFDDGFSYIGQDLKNNKDFIMKCLNTQKERKESFRNSWLGMAYDYKDTTSLEYVGSDLKADREVVLTAVQINGLNFKHVNWNLRADPEVALAAIKDNALAFFSASPYLKKDKYFALDAIKCNPDVYSCLNRVYLQRDREIAITAVRQKAELIKELPENLKNDKEIAIIAVRDKPSLLKDLENFQDNREVVLAAVQNGGYSLEFASPRLKNDKEIALAAVTQDYEAFAFVPENLKNDVDITEAAKLRNTFWTQKLANEKKGLARD